MNIQQFLNDRLTLAMVAAGAPETAQAIVKVSSKPQFGDYQANGVMGSAKKLGQNPRILAQKVVELVDLGEVVDKLEIAGPGFINLWINDHWLCKQSLENLKSDRLGISNCQHPERIVIDYSSPNVAKEMHIGHIRCNCIGDAIVRIAEFLGHTVIRANHIGDWGTQFGMLIAHLEELQQENPSHQTDELEHLEQFYKASKRQFDENPEFQQKAREYVVKLQQGDPWCLSMWQQLVDITMSQNQKAYDRMNISLSPKDTMGESLYNDQLPAVVELLKSKNLAIQDQGAWVVKLEAFNNKDGEPLGVIVQKRDGGYLYTTTDIAAAQYRVQQLDAHRIVIFTDSRQSQHMQQLETICRLADILPESVHFEHHPFGMVLGKDGKPFKTRSGETVKLMDVLDEAEERALTLVKKRQPDMTANEQQHIAEILSISSVKYAELSKHRLTDYVFDWNAMLAFEGNTAPYLLYAYTRIHALFRKAQASPQDLYDSIQVTDSIQITTKEERILLIELIRFNEILETVQKEALPHLLCTYLYNVSSTYMSFYESCPIFNDNTPEDLKISRLALCLLVSRTLKQGLELMGINTLNRM